MSATDCVPTAVGTVVGYHNNLLAGAKKVCVRFEQWSEDISANIDTLDGLLTTNTVIVNSTLPQTEGTPAGNNYWKSAVAISFHRDTGDIYLNVLFKGDSQIFSNLRITKIYYEK